MNSKKIMAILLAVLVVLCLGNYIWHAADEAFVDFFSEGVHTAGKHAFLNLHRPCYYIDPDTLEVSGRTIFTAFGFLENEPRWNTSIPLGMYFNGLVELEDYAVTLHEATGTCTGSMSDEIIVLTAKSKANLYVTILRQDPEVIYLQIVEGENKVRSAICGWSEEDALENYQRYLECKNRIAEEQ